MVEVVVNTSSLNRTGMGSITGQVFLQSKAGTFPEDRWSDFPVVILAWWIEGLSALVDGRERSFQGLFMDGPFAFIVQGGAGVSGHIAWGKRGEEAPIGIVDVAALLRSAVAAGRLVAESCRSRSWAGKDLEMLERAIAQSAA